MELIRPDVNIDFVRYTKSAAFVSLVFILAGLISIWFRGGLNYGVDFTGGIVVHVKFTQPTSIAEIRQALGVTDIVNVTVQDFGQGGNEFLIRMPTVEGDVASLSEQVQQGLLTQFGTQAFEIRRVEAVGPKVGKDLRRKALLAVLFATIMMGVYIALRFELRFGIGALIALIHDVLITLGALSLMALELDLTVVAALLTIVGFSVNDTVIVCDRIRENMRKLRRDSLATIINRSLNDTLSRTIITNGTALITVLVLFVLGGEVIHAFAFALLVGFIAGTYSSIYIASPIVLFWGEKGRRR
ncbi:MAG TPA: protein translocase subunit SecF [Candidatus Binatia bacterium]|jgi:preprotein translocase subunit SecF|nr:protein translocase subunit SecF [Candidatus Binatia bacterium]